MREPGGVVRPATSSTTSDAHDRRGKLSTVGELDPVLGRFHQTPIALGDLVALMQSMTAPVEVP
jgi:hypothetical protein